MKEIKGNDGFRELEDKVGNCLREGVSILPVGQFSSNLFYKSIEECKPPERIKDVITEERNRANRANRAINVEKNCEKAEQTLEAYKERNGEQLSESDKNKKTEAERAVKLCEIYEYFREFITGFCVDGTWDDEQKVLSELELFFFKEKDPQSLGNNLGRWLIEERDGATKPIGLGEKINELTRYLVVNIPISPVKVKEYMFFYDALVLQAYGGENTTEYKMVRRFRPLELDNSQNYTIKFSESRNSDQPESFDNLIQWTRVIVNETDFYIAELIEKDKIVVLVNIDDTPLEEVINTNQRIVRTRDDNGTRNAYQRDKYPNLFRTRVGPGFKYAIGEDQKDLILKREETRKNGFYNKAGFAETGFTVEDVESILGSNPRQQALPKKAKYVEKIMQLETAKIKRNDFYRSYKSLKILRRDFGDAKDEEEEKEEEEIKKSKGLLEWSCSNNYRVTEKVTNAMLAYLQHAHAIRHNSQKQEHYGKDAFLKFFDKVRERLKKIEKNTKEDAQDKVNNAQNGGNISNMANSLQLIPAGAEASSGASAEDTAAEAEDGATEEAPEEAPAEDTAAEAEDGATEEAPAEDTADQIFLKKIDNIIKENVCLVPIRKEGENNDKKNGKSPTKGTTAKKNAEEEIEKENKKKKECTKEVQTRLLDMFKRKI